VAEKPPAAIRLPEIRQVGPNSGRKRGLGRGTSLARGTATEKKMPVIRNFDRLRTR
jgi:hypothetical protein